MVIKSPALPDFLYKYEEKFRLPELFAVWDASALRVVRPFSFVRRIVPCKRIFYFVSYQLRPALASATSGASI